MARSSLNACRKVRLPSDVGANVGKYTKVLAGPVRAMLIICVPIEPRLFLTAMRARSSSRRVCSRSGATALLAARVIDSKLWQSYVAKMQSKRELDVDLHQNPTPIGIGHAIANSAQSIGDALLFGAIVTICRSATRHLPTRSAPGTTFARGGGMRVR